MEAGGNGSGTAESVCPIGVPAAGDETLPLVAFHSGPAPPVKIMPAGRWREWMNATSERFANRCLPLLVANQSGWVLLNTAPFRASWDGGDTTGSLAIEYPEDATVANRIAKSHFGYGIVTFHFDLVLCTAPGWNLLARGPANSPKDGVAALEGVIETDWSATPFTMNWKLTRPGEIEFGEAEPFCQVVPQARGELERFRPAYESLRDRPELEKRMRAWGASRQLVELGKHSTREAGDDKWRRFWFEDYFKGRAPTGESSPEHQTTLRLAPFAEQTRS